jgi:hypothetical protein
MTGLRCIGLAVLMAASSARAFELCDDHGKLEDFRIRQVPWEKAFEEKRFDELDRHLNRLMTAQEAGTISDAEAKRAFAIFESSRPGREPLHLEWLRGHPRSPAALLAIAYHYMQRWSASGNEVDMRDSIRAFDFAAERSKSPTLAIAGKIRIASDSRGGAGLDPAILYRKAIEQYPGTLEVRIEFIRASNPKRGGTLNQLNAITADARRLPVPDQRYVEYLVYQEMAAAMEDAKDDMRAAEFYEKSIPLCPGLDKSLTQVAGVYKRLKRYDVLVPAMTAYIARNPRVGWGYTTRGLANRELGKHAEAFADYDHAVQLGDAAALGSLAWFFETGTAVPRDKRKALELYEVAASRDVDGAREKADKLRALLGAKSP